VNSLGLLKNRSASDHNLIKRGSQYWAAVTVGDSSTLILFNAPPLGRFASETAGCKIDPMKTKDRWMLFEYVDGLPSPLSKPFKTKKLAEKAREKFPEHERKRIGVGLIRG
jgi:hypothetical protein